MINSKNHVGATGGRQVVTNVSPSVGSTTSGVESSGSSSRRVFAAGSALSKPGSGSRFWGFSMTDLASLGISINPRGSAQQRVACPRCARSGRDDALSVNIEAGLYHCFRCDWKGHADQGDVGFTPVARLNDPVRAQRKRDRLRQVWNESLPLTHVAARPVRTYLESRALGDILNAPPSVLRAHRGLIYWDGTKSLGRYPAMVALYHGCNGQPLTLHVTYLREDGCSKACVPSPKKMLPVSVPGATKGGAIRLHEPVGGVLGLCEGIETALSLHILIRIPTWAAFCADNLSRASLPGSLRELHIGVDMDASRVGESVAEKLAARVSRWESRPKVVLWRPEVPCPADLNDELRRKSI